MKRLIYLMAASLIFTGCRKYVEIDQTGTRTFKYTNDYRALLDNSATMEASFSLPMYSGDDTRFLDSSKQVAMQDIYANAYTWQPQYWSDIQGDVDWERLYKSIYTCNEILNGVMTSERGNDDQKRQLYAEALVNRAYFYWSLVSLYAKQYDAATAAADPGVPLLLTPDLFAPLKRASVSTVYDQIISDLKEAAPALPDLPDYNTRPSKAAAYALLARTYLGMRDFTNAMTYADMTLAIQNDILDLRNYATDISAFPYRLDNKEVIISKTATGFYFTSMQADTDLLSLLGSKDLRFTLFIRPGSNFAPAFTGYGFWRHRYSRETNVINNGPGVAEMMLIKAECAARNNDAATAIELLNKLREKRFLAADYTALEVGTAAEALKSVVDERKRELFGTGLRWIDQKRLSKDVAFATTVIRRFKGIEYTLEPNSNRYVYPIGQKYILLNPEIEQNP
ncbi:RagB/SusD family nutrient uptake outer membrane protein [Chitinophaga rhizophila]|uniref:RagB/SusD family nutrient uptake outer membrane protein n=1 Tax=Chitinophaga rhizophila TaxID=2866212 RepID=A0ABS7G5R4_9BACT|nr:RagB/SusD family nutrient uptake outer membrane protein [Chitinophaga rhizophila]MBW8682972.1 RagB/SusD family nutrient uptake outer membrane protein [Chitinophaga rhizophila]